MMIVAIKISFHPTVFSRSPRALSLSISIVYTKKKLQNTTMAAALYYYPSHPRLPSIAAPSSIRLHPFFLSPIKLRHSNLLLYRRRHVALSGNSTFSAALLQDGGATAAVLVGAYSLVLVFDNLTKRNLIEQSLSRKVVHVLSGLLFMSSWSFFSSSMEARYFAATVPLVNCLRLLVYGLGFLNDEGLIKSITREGKREELLSGPLYYVMVLMFCCLVFWRDSPVGILVLSMMSGGDGFADILGRRFGSLKLPFNQRKSWVGSISMFLFGFLSSIGMIYYFSAFGFLNLDWNSTVQKVALVSLVAAAVESLPTTKYVDDNVSVPMATMISAMLLFG